AFRRFALVIRILGRETEHVANAEGLQLSEVVAEGTGLWRATPRTRDHIPSVRIFDARPSGAGVRVNNDATLYPGQINGVAVGSPERHGCHPGAREVAGSSIVKWRRDSRPIGGFHCALHSQASHS